MPEIIPRANGPLWGWQDDGSFEPDIQTVNEQLADIAIDVKAYGAKGDGVTDDTAAIQAAFNQATSLMGGDTSSTSGYIGFYEPEVIFPTGTYICGTIAIPSKIKIRGIGQAVIKSNVGTSSSFAGQLVNNIVTDLFVKGLTFLYFDTCFTVPTNNSDFSFITFEECNIAQLNTFVDTVSYSSSRSTTFKMERCRVTYGVTTLAKVYTDKSFFEGNWFIHSSNTFFMYLDSFASFKNNVWVPTNTGTSKAYINFTASDAVRSLQFDSERFGGESGSCPIVIVGNVNLNNTNDVYRQQGILFKNCVLSSTSYYDPNGIGTVKANVILSPTMGGLNSINYISFIGCTHTPDLSGGVVQTYNVTDITTLISNDFVIEYDYASSVSATKGTNVLASSNLLRYVKTPTISRNVFGPTKGSGQLKATTTATTGQLQVSFGIDRIWPTTYHAPLTFLVTCVGQGDSSYPSISYVSQTVYVLTINGTNGATTFSQIQYTKLHGVTSGASGGAKADINSATFADSGTNQEALDSSHQSHNLTVNINFGTRLQSGYVYLTPLFDFGLKS